MALEKLTSYLDEKGIKYVVVRHSKAFTAQEVAASAHIPGKEMVKTVMVNVDDDIKMFVLPSTHDVDFEAIKDTFDAENVELASESEFEDMFPDCEIGAMPPFGNLFDMDSYVAEVLTEDEKIAFNAGTHKEVVKMNYKDFEDLVNPEIVSIAVRAMS
ncbi:MAG: YbaK/EbsC family protein [Balneolaceae bacterium]|nr:YbaK/EbsC family protein [Balneolaceae bacterium]MDR9410393.1 YbaK/EbsC family protein [Balneolaceae bacterium]